MLKSCITKAILHIASWYPNPQDPRLGNFVEQHLLALKAQGESICLLSAFPGSRPEIIYKAKPFPQVQVLYRKRGPVLSHYLALKRGFSFLQEQGFELDFAHLHVCHPSGIAFLGFLRKMPFVISEHYSGYQVIRQHEWSKVSQRIARRTFNKARVVAPVSEALGNSLRDFGVKSTIEAIGNAVDPEVFQYQAPEGAEEFRFLHISSLQEHTKNISGIVNAFAAFAEEQQAVKLVIGGDGDRLELRSALEAKLSPDKYEILATMNPQEVAEEMRKSQAFLLFSNVENQPVVLLESLCIGRPVIASNVGGISEVIDEQNGILVEAGNQNALGNAMVKMMEDYARYDLAKISQAAQQRHSYRAIAQRFKALYASVRP